MNIDEKEYFFDEVRDGFFIPSKTKKCWAVSYKNLCVLNDVCEKAGLQWFSMWGTLLGCVRSAGFVPWDDDIDTVMFRAGFEIINKLSRDEKLPGQYWISDYEYNENDNMTRSFTDSGSLVRTVEACKEYYGYPLYNAIDIFILDNLPCGEEEISLHKSIIELFIALSEQAKQLTKQKLEGIDSVSKDKLVDEKTFIDNLTQLLKDTNTPFIQDSRIPLFVRVYKALDEYCASIKQTKNSSVSTIWHFINLNYRLPRRLFEGHVEMPFENGKIRVPIGYDGILRYSFGEYMKPIIGGGIHEYPIYRIIEQQVKDIAGVEYRTYCFDINKYNEVISKRTKRKRLKEILIESVSLFKDAHAFISNRSKDDYIDNELLEVLGQCQELAVSIGERIENDVVDGGRFIKIFEGYCNDLFGLYTCFDNILSGKSYDSKVLIESRDSLFEFEKAMIEISEQITEKKEIVILCYRPENWKSLHSIYEELREKKNINTVVIRVPYYYKDYDGKINSNNPIIKKEGYPKGIVFTDYDKYDFECKHPDVIINQWPYDDYNESICIHPYFYSSNLCLYTNRLVLIPPFVTREIYGVDKLRETIRVFLSSPGVIYADEIIAQSNTIRDSYIEIVEEFIKKETNAQILDFESKIKGIGSAIFDWESRKRILIKSDDGRIYDKIGNETSSSIYDEVVEVSSETIYKLRQSNGRFKKIIALFLSGSVVYEHGKSIIDKYKKVIQILRKREDILVWWYLDPLAAEILRKYEKDSWKAYREFCDEFKKDNLGVFDNTGNDYIIRNLSDMMYGDACSLMNYIRENKKPVLWQTPGCPIDESEGYVKKKWDDNIVIATEASWSLINFLDEATQYEISESNDGNGKRIVEQLLN